MGMDGWPLPTTREGTPRDRRRRETPRQSIRASHAFTLLEIVVVVSIIAIASAIAVPQLSSSISRARVTSAAQRIIADLARARARAIAQSKGVTITFGRVAYEVAGDQRATQRAIPPIVELAQSPYYTQVQIVDFAGAASITYDMFGQPSAGGSITISSGSQSLVIKIDEGCGFGAIR
jgi:prepilin-type N-terminal cleavage/methylation domain-containing protein